MTVYPASAEEATCTVAGCVCAQRVPRYPSDMTDAEWEVLGPQARAVMAKLRHGPGGRPMTHRLRVVVDAIRYLVWYGVEWSSGRCPRISRRGWRCTRSSSGGPLSGGQQSAPAGGRPAAGAAAGGRWARRGTVRCGDRFPVG